MNSKSKALEIGPAALSQRVSIVGSRANLPKEESCALVSGTCRASLLSILEIRRKVFRKDNLGCLASS